MRPPPRTAGPDVRRGGLLQTGLWLVGLLLLLTGCATPPRSGEWAAGGTKVLPLDGESFLFQGHEAFLIPPGGRGGRGTPWVWYAPTLPGLPGPEERWLFERFRAAGIGVAGIDAGESYGSPDGVRLFEAFHRHLVRDRHWSRRPCLLARSRGGLQLLAWAVAHPGSVGAFAGIYPVCDPSSYPGPDRAAPAYGLQPEEMRRDPERYSPLSRLGPVARAGVPVFLLHGNVDTVVPLDRNSGEFARRYRLLGGPVWLEIPEGQGHSMWPGFFQSEAMAGFIVRETPRPGAGRRPGTDPHPGPLPASVR